MDKPLRTPPPYPIASVDHALRAATILQMEGGATVSQIAERLGVARSTAHRLLAMLVHRDFAVQDEGRVYRPGPVLEPAAQSPSLVSRLRTTALPHLQRIVDLLDETTNLIVRTRDTARFIASVECRQALRVGSREGMVFPAHRTTAGLLLLAELTDEELDAAYAPERYRDRPADRPDLARLRTELKRLRRTGFAVNKERSERGLVAVGVLVRDPDGTALAGLSVSMPSMRYDPHHLQSLVATLDATARALEKDLAEQGPRPRETQEAEMAGTALTGTTVAEVMAELATLEDPKIRAVNERHGDDHGVNLSKLRALAKRLKTQQDLARRLWETDDTAARLLALLICRPKAFARDELDVMLRQARSPKVHDWLVNYVVKKNPHAEELRLAWSDDPDPVVASAGWALTTERVAKKPEGLDLPGLLDVIEAEMKDAPDRLQWAMNHCLAQIGISHAEYRTRAIAIGERLEVLKDYPTSPGCTSPFAPTWITEMVRRQGDQS
jgi:DNA-binding IclR family transcriptional regulator/3-methyladenine DNA glycosylase AlkD